MRDMKWLKNLFLNIIALGMWPLLFAKTEVCGEIRLPTDWTLAESPYIVTNDITIPENSRLRIEAGVVVLFTSPKPCAEEVEKQKQLEENQPKEKEHPKEKYHKGESSPKKIEAKSADKHEEKSLAEEDLESDVPAKPKFEDFADSLYVGIKIEGSFYVLGSEEQPVIFQSMDTLSTKTKWDGLRFYGQNAEQVEIGFASFKNAHHALHLRKSTFFIHHNIFLHNNTGIYLIHKSKPIITNNNFLSNQSAGIYTEESNPKIANNIFYENKTYGIWSDSRLNVQILNNAFANNGEEHCYKCPFHILRLNHQNPNNDTCDANFNLLTDPLFFNSTGFKLAQQNDLNLDTPGHLVKDPQIAELEKKARGKWWKRKAKAAKPFELLGKGSYLLSSYSKLTHAGHVNKSFNNRDESVNDIGIHGGHMGRMTRDPF